MKKIFNNLQLFLVVIIAIAFTSCTEEKTPTHELMQGVWEVTEAYDENDSSIMENVNHLIPTYITLDDANGVISTAGPMFMYIVYGKSNFVKVTSKLDEAFKYADLTLTNGEFFMNKDEVVDRFTIEMKLEFPFTETITSILDLMGLGIPSFMEPVIYHKFKDIKVEIDDTNKEMMIWTFDTQTTAVYNIKDEYGDYVSWTGMSTESFQKCTFVLTKRVGDIEQFVSDSYDKKK